MPHSDIAKPGVQKPHCEPWHSTSACCTGCSAPSGLLQVFDREQGLAVERGRELDAGIDRLQFQLAVFQRTDDHGAGAAVALGAAFLGAGAAQVLPQVLQDGLRRRHVAHFVDGVAEVKADRFGMLASDLTSVKDTPVPTCGQLCIK
jgi:hypothetical protein